MLICTKIEEYKKYVLSILQYTNNKYIFKTYNDNYMKHIYVNYFLIFLA